MDPGAGLGSARSPGTLHPGEGLTQQIAAFGSNRDRLCRQRKSGGSGLFDSSIAKPNVVEEEYFGVN